MADVCKIKTDSGTYDVYDERVDELLQNTLTIKAASYIGGTWSVTGGDESYSGTIDADETEIGLKAHQTTYTVTVTFEGVEFVETVTTGIYFNHYEVEFGPVADLEDLTWAEVSKISQAGSASAYWAVGDVKGVELDTYVNASYPIQGTFYAYILGFDHNADIEGKNTVHWQFGKLEDGTNICFRDATMNSTNTNDGGWEACEMRNTTCTAFLEALPADLQAVIREVTKYTENTGGYGKTHYTTATTDKLFLPTEFEVYGKTVFSDDTPSYLAWYDYYKAGNAITKYYHSNTSTNGQWWLRSPYSGTSTANYHFLYAFSESNTNYSDPTRSYGFAPCFVV